MKRNKRTGHYNHQKPKIDSRLTWQPIKFADKSDKQQLMDDLMMHGLTMLPLLKSAQNRKNKIA